MPRRVSATTVGATTVTARARRAGGAARAGDDVLRRLGAFQADTTQRLADLSAQLPDNPEIRALDQAMAGLSTQLAERIRACGPACAPPPGTPGSAGPPGGAGVPDTVPTTVPSPAGGAGVGASAGSEGAGSAGAGADVDGGGASVRASLPGGGGAGVGVGSTPTVSACVPVPLINNC